MILYIILIVMAIGLIIIAIRQKQEIERRKELYKALNDDFKKQKEKLDFMTNELNRCQDQINIYEKEEQNVPYLKINGKILKINPIYRGKRAIVGDYNRGSFENTLRVLKTFGLTVDVVKSGKDIVERINHGYKYDIIFTNNIYDNGVTGYSTLHDLKEIKGFDTPVIIHSISDNKRHEFIDVDGFDDYVVKPLTQQKIKPILKKFLKESK